MIVIKTPTVEMLLGHFPDKMKVAKVFLNLEKRMSLQIRDLFHKDTIFHIIRKKYSITNYTVEKCH